jgi:tetratricopeptide (TPR) repeat protein
MVGSCSGWKCNRMISISAHPGGNEYALSHPDEFSVEFAICTDCKQMFCDRCAMKRRGRSDAPICASCGGELADGRRYWEQVGRLPYPDAVTSYNKARELAESGQIPAALSGFEEAIRLRPDYVSALFDRGIALAELGRKREAAQAYGDVLRVDAGNAQAAFDKGTIHLQLNELPAAIDAFDRAIRIEPRFAEPIVNKAHSLMKEGRYEESAHAFGEAIRLLETKANVGRADQTLPFAYGGLGACLLNLGRDAEGLESLDRAIDNGLDDALTLRNRALALERLGRDEEARLAYRMADDVCRETS